MRIKCRFIAHFSWEVDLKEWKKEQMDQCLMSPLIELNCVNSAAPNNIKINHRPPLTSNQ